jgi:hypothetical protein
MNISELEQQLHKLPCADGAAFNSRLWEHKPRCLPETRVSLLDEITKWSRNYSGPCIYWLNGMAGTGKSTIAHTVARDHQERLGGSFFFSRGQGDLGHATKFFTTLAAQLANALPDLKPYICQAIARNPDVFQQSLAEQWKNLIFQPLSDLREASLQSRLFILVIDALDECEDENDIRLILRLFAQAKTLGTVRLRIFITSRPETPIRLGFRVHIPEAEHQDFVLHHVPQDIIQGDISIFLRHELDIIRRESEGRPRGWPGEDKIELLCQKARGLFIYASTACRFIGDQSRDPDDSLSFILKDDYVGQSVTGNLDDMYTKILTHAAVGDRDREKPNTEFKQIVGSIVILLDALPAVILDQLLFIRKGTVHRRLRSLHSVLDIPKSQESPIRLLHPSFRDFLLKQQRCSDPRFWINKTKAHDHVFKSCLKLMSKRLKRDMGNLQLPGALKHTVENGIVENADITENKFIPLGVQYACRHWAYHLLRSKIQLHDNCQVHIFLQKHFLHWIEALCLIGELSEGIFALRSLESILTVSECTAVISTML